LPAPERPHDSRFDVSAAFVFGAATAADRFGLVDVGFKTLERTPKSTYHALSRAFARTDPTRAVARQDKVTP